MLELIKTKFRKVIAALREDESHPVKAEFVLTNKGTKYQHAKIRVPLPVGYSLEYWWIRPGVDGAKCYMGQPHWDKKDYRPFVEVEVRKYLEDK